jgi:hypothetical protein
LRQDLDHILVANEILPRINFRYLFNNLYSVGVLAMTPIARSL